VDDKISLTSSELPVLDQFDRVTFGRKSIKRQGGEPRRGDNAGSATRRPQRQKSDRQTMTKSARRSWQSVNALPDLLQLSRFNPVSDRLARDVELSQLNGRDDPVLACTQGIDLIGGRNTS
jgi:hypothetical protein